MPAAGIGKRLVKGIFVIDVKEKVLGEIALHTASDSLPKIPIVIIRVVPGKDEGVPGKDLETYLSRKVAV